jgi:hypothetical protein
MLFLQNVLEDLGTWCCTSTLLDLKTIKKRVEDEGISFLTISLAQFGADFQKSLDQGYVGSDQFAGFRRTGGLPRLFSGFLCHIFDSESGRLIDNPSIVHIHAIRQITLMWAKIDLPCTDARRVRALRKFIDCEQDVKHYDKNWTDESRSRFSRIGTLLWADVLTSVDETVYRGEIIPQHGPGATADRKVGNDKWRITEWTERLDSQFPVGEFVLPNQRYWKDLSGVHILEPGAERPVRVITVPKTLKTPRIIAIEPVCMQYVQQGLLGEIQRAVEANDTARQLIGWQSSVPNQHLACIGSRNEALATLDLREASDRVSNQHVRVLLRNFGSLLAAVDAARSRKAAVLELNRTIRLAKFASMGSALTFPMEAMVFCTVVFMGIEKALNRPLTRKDIKSLTGQVRVYGDDIIVPVDYVHAVIEELETFGFLVNSSKSFWTGKFRESCGKEYYDGSDVSIVRIRSMLPSSRKHAEEIVSTVSLRNHLYEAGLWKAAGYLDDLLERIIPFPMVGPESPVLGRRSFLGYETQRICRHLHRPLVKGMVVTPSIPASVLDGVPALLKVLSKTSGLPNPDPKHLERAGRPRSTDIKARWSVPY